LSGTKHKESIMTLAANTNNMTDPRATWFSLPAWARAKVEEHIEDVQFYVDSDWSLSDAMAKVLDASVLGETYKKTVRDYFA
jgi:hypothetical protein